MAHWSPDRPRWFGQLRWSPAHAIATIEARSIPEGAGIYVFTSSPGPLSRGTVLYVGKADGAIQTLRRRIGTYLSRFRGGKATRHGGKEDLADFVSSEGAGRVFVRWAGCVMARDVEGGLIDMFEPTFNRRDEIPGIAYDETLPSWSLY
jgi:hypothetical protein